MQQSTAQRRLVKSPPELWAEVSSETTLGRHFAEFGEIRITRMEPETAVAWEGARASGTVELAPAGWGTKVILTATPALAAASQARAPDPPPPPPDPVALDAPPPPPPLPAPKRRGLLARLFRRAAAPEPAPTLAVAAARAPRALVPSPSIAFSTPPTTAAPSLDADRTVAILTGVLDDLGAAHRLTVRRD